MNYGNLAAGEDIVPGIKFGLFLGLFDLFCSGLGVKGNLNLQLLAIPEDGQGGGVAAAELLQGRGEVFVYGEDGVVQLQEDIASDQMCLKEFKDPFTGEPVVKGK